MGIDIKIDKAKVTKDTYIEIKRIIAKHIPNIQSALNNEISKIIFNRLSMGIPSISGQDLYEIGIPDINTRIMSIVDAASKSIEIKVSLSNMLKIEIGILRKDYSDLLSLPESVYTYISSRGSGVLEWLRWLLLEGDGIIVSNFEFSPSNNPFSRTGGGFMVTGTNWKVPSNLSGTSQNNILTRALENIEKDIESVVAKQLRRIIK